MTYEEILNRDVPQIKAQSQIYARNGICADIAIYYKKEAVDGYLCHLARLRSLENDGPIGRSLAESPSLATFRTHRIGRFCVPKLSRKHNRYSHRTCKQPSGCMRIDSALMSPIRRRHDMTKSFISFDVSAFDWFLNDAGQQYEKSSPTVETWLDQVADRLRDGSVTIRELRLVDSLLENGIWLDPHGAGNLAYKAMSEFGVLPSNITIAF